MTTSSGETRRRYPWAAIPGAAASSRTSGPADAGSPPPASSARDPAPRETLRGRGRRSITSSIALLYASSRESTATISAFARAWRQRTPMWKIDDRVTHRFNTDLGVGRVAALEGRNLVVEFAQSNTVLRFGAATDALLPWDERGIPSSDDSPIERLALGDVASLDAFSVRLDAMHLAASRASDDLGSFLGGRIRLFPHQLDVALKATRQDPVRWLLADEVGLGKTVEACLIANHLIRTRRTERTLVVAPETLTVQWLGELWRKYHQVFVLLDEATAGRRRARLRSRASTPSTPTAGRSSASTPWSRVRS